MDRSGWLDEFVLEKPFDDFVDGVAMQLEGPVDVLHPNAFPATPSDGLVDSLDEGRTQQGMFFCFFWLRKLPEYYFLAQAFANLHGKRRQGK